MKFIAVFIFGYSTFGFGQTEKQNDLQSKYVVSIPTLTLEAAFVLQKQASSKATEFDKNVSVAILDAAGIPILITRGAGVGSHNTEAARRKAFTSLSTKTPTLELLRNAAKNLDTQNLNSLPELLLLSGGRPIYYQNQIIGSIGVTGGGSAENDDIIAKSVGIQELAISTKNKTNN